MKRKAIFLGLAVVLLAAAAFFLLYPRTTGPVLRLQEDTRIQSVILRENGTEQIWTPVTEADREKELTWLMTTSWAKAPSTWSLPPAVSWIPGAIC